MSPKSLVCGIDLGTTNSCLAVLQDGQATVVEIDGYLTMPSVLAFRDGQWIVGHEAKNHLWIAPDEGVASIKRRMDDLNYQVQLGGESLSPVAVSAKILRALVDRAQHTTGQELSQAVITVPAWFKEQQRQATLEAGRLAGLNILQIINEPTAAALAYDVQSLAQGEQQHWLVYDLGGGTFDVSLLNVTSAGFEVMASAGNTFLGGDDFDQRLVDRLVAQLHNQHSVDVKRDPMAMARLRLRAEQTKIALSDQTEVTISEPLIILGDTYTLSMTITRTEFEELIADLLDSTLSKVEQVLADGGIGAEQLGKLLLVGGSTRIPTIAEQLQQRFSMAAESWVDPDLSVAMGACVQAAIATHSLFDRNVVDICPHTLGIAAYGELDVAEGTELMDSTHPLTFTPLIRRNSRLPARFVRSFNKLHERQESAIIAVYQGEHSNTRQNHFVGEFNVEFERNNSIGVDIGFSYDISGTIKISVKEAGLGEQIYSMNTIDGHFEMDDASDDDALSELEPMQSRAMNYLIEKVLSKLEQIDPDNNAVLQMLDDYRTLLQQDDADDNLDELESKLYEWLEADAS